MEIVTGVASFLGGALMSALVFMFAFVSRLTRVETTLTNLCDTVNRIKADRDVCPLHNEIDKRLALAEAKLGKQ